MLMYDWKSINEKWYAFGSARRSGTSEEDFKACVHNGVSKINVATAIQIGVTEKYKPIWLSRTPNYIENEI